MCWKRPAEIVDLANEKMDNQFRENVVFTLADHIDFSVQRYRKNINIKLPLLYEVRQLYPENLSWASRRWIS